MFRSNKMGRMTVVPAVLLVLVMTAGVFAAGGCGEAGDNTGTTGSSGDSVVHPGGKTEVVLRVSTGGGFVPVSYNLTHLPEFTLYGDGTVIVTGPVIAIYPGPAMPNLQTTRISEEGIQAVLSAAREAGLFASGVDYGRPGITDVATTTITINADGTTYRSDIYALGMDSGAGGLTMDQQQARAGINDLAGKLSDLAAFETGELEWTPYEYSALAIYAVAVDPAGVPDVQPNRLEWPLGDLSTVGEPVQPEGYRKVVVSGEDLAKLQPLLGEATQVTVWTAGDREHNLSFRPLLPDETV